MGMGWIVRAAVISTVAFIAPGMIGWSDAGGQASNTVPGTAPAPRAANGKPDLTGVYQDSVRRGAWDFDTPGDTPGVAAPRLREAAVIGRLPNEPPLLQPAARAKAQELLNRRSIDNPTAYCIPPPGPRVSANLFPIQLIQTPEQLVILHEYMGAFRVFPIDGRKQPDDIEPAYMGNSVGRWDGDTLVVDVIGFKDGVWLGNGIVATDALHVTERYTRVDRDQLNYVATIEDPSVFTKPWTVRRTFMLREGFRLNEDVCAENNLDPAVFQEYLKKPELILRSPGGATPR